MKKKLKANCSNVRMFGMFECGRVVRCAIAAMLCAAQFSAMGYTGMEDVTIAVGETITKTIDDAYSQDPSQMSWRADATDSVTVQLNPSRYTGKPYALQITGLAVGTVAVEIQGGGSPSERFNVTVVPPPPVEYLDWDEVNKELTNATCTAYEVVTNEMAVFEAGKTYAVLSNVTNTMGITVKGTPCS